MFLDGCSSRVILTFFVPNRSHLVNDGVEESPPLSSSSSTVVVDDGSSDEPFIDLDGANVGLQHWHPMPVTAHGGRLAGQSQMGGVWEWTSTPLRKHEGFEPLSLYPGYTGTLVLLGSAFRPPAAL
jgi:L-histidine Nalpha-methyltransferase / hercynylcysteine S-oxide synthase